jgi:methyl-accepting chemotaxis protein
VATVGLFRLRLTTQIFLGFGVLILLLVGVAGFGSYGLSRAGTEIATMVKLSNSMRRTQATVLRLEQMRQALVRYMVDAKPEDLKLSTDAVAAAVAEVNDGAKVTSSQERRTLYTDIAAKLAVLSPKLDRFAPLIANGLAERARLAEAGDALEAAIGQLSEAARSSSEPNDRGAAADARASIMGVRFNASRFVNAPSGKLADAFGNSAADAETAMAGLEKLASPALLPTIAPARAAFDRYKGSFAKLSGPLVQGHAIFGSEIRHDIDFVQEEIGRAEQSLSKSLDASRMAATDETAQALLQQDVLSGVGTLLAVAIAALMARSIIRPVRGMTDAMTRLAAGNTDVHVPARERADEIGRMAHAVEVFRQQAIDNVRLAEERERAREAKERRQSAMDRNLQDFGASVAGVMATFMSGADDLRRVATEVSQAAERTHESTSRTVTGAESSARDLASVAAGAEQLSTSITEINRQVSSVTGSVQTAVTRARETDGMVAGLSEAADRIGDVVRVIANIASQTNLLALNATIEAARAGDAGKGFAVVASEVKTLAKQTALATDQISAQIVGIRSATKQAVEAVRDVGSAIADVSEVAGSIAAAVEQQTGATRNITENAHSVSSTTTSSAEALRDVVAIAESTAASSNLAARAADEIGEAAETLRAEVTNFLAAVSHGGEEERRRYERIPADGFRAELSFGGQAPVHADINDISRGGISLAHTGPEAVGTDSRIVLPGGASVRARIARKQPGFTAFSFRQDEASLAGIDRALTLISQGRRALAA